MKFSDSFIQEVRNAASIVEVVGSYVELKRRGRNHVGRCPFHNEKTPSFNVSDDRQWYHCFGCGASGDIFKFLGQVESLSFPDAVRWVADKYGIRIPVPARREAVSPEDSADKKRLSEAMQAAESFFRLALEKEGAEAQEYLRGRGIQEETAERFRIGYAPPGGGRMLNHLQELGFPLPLLEKAGLVKKSEQASGYYDYFRRRLIFPIKDSRGQTIAFGGRVLDDGIPKYLNSPETLLYSKGRNLFGLFLSREAIRQQNHAILVEGYLDCIVPYQEGIRNVVASLGTSLTPEQVRLLGRYTKNIVVNFDPDAAGVNAARRSLDLFLDEGFRVNVLRLPKGQDPDTFIRESGAAEYRRLLTQSESYIEFLSSEASREMTTGGSRGRIKAVNFILPFLAKIRDRVERIDYATRVARRLGLDDRILLSELRKAADQRTTVLDEKKIQKLPELLPSERRILRLLLTNSEMGCLLLSQISDSDFSGLRTESLVKAIREEYARCGRVDFSELEQRFSGSEEMQLLSGVYFDDKMPSIRIEDGIKSLNAVKCIQLERQKAELQLEIERNGTDMDKEQLALLHRQKMEIIRRIYELNS